MVLGQADGPLAPSAAGPSAAHAPVLVERFSLRVRPNTNAPAYAGLVRKSCTAP